MRIGEVGKNRVIEFLPAECDEAKLVICHILEGVDRQLLEGKRLEIMFFVLEK